MGEGQAERRKKAAEGGRRRKKAEEEEEFENEEDADLLEEAAGAGVNTDGPREVYLLQLSLLIFNFRRILTIRNSFSPLSQIQLSDCQKQLRIR